MRVLHIMQCANLGGMEQTTLLRMGLLKASGYHPRFLSLNPIRGLGSLLERNGIPAQGLPYRGRWGWRSLGLMYRAFRAEPADAVIMHGHNLAAMVALGNVGRGRRLLCLHYHHTGVKPGWEWRVIYRVALKQFPRVTFPSDFVRQEAERIYPPLAAVAQTLPNPFVLPPLPSEQERLQARERLGLPMEAKVVGNAGWLIQRKRFDVFLRVAREVAAAVPGTLFVIAGDGPLRGELVELSRALGIAELVRWLGWQQDLGPFYSALDVLHFNSDWDAVGRTPLEALAYSVPVVASVANGGLREILDSEEYGFLSATHNVSWLAGKITFFLSDPEAARNSTVAARTRLASVCSPEKDRDTLVRLLRLEHRE